VLLPPPKGSGFPHRGIIMKFKVRFDSSFDGDCLMEFDSIAEAENNIAADVSTCMELHMTPPVIRADFGHKTEVWESGGNAYASWERLWKKNEAADVDLAAVNKETAVKWLSAP